MMLYSDTKIVVQRELVTAQHLRPWEPVVTHAGLAAGLDGLTEGATWVDRTIKTDRSEQRTQEHLSVLVTTDIQQWNPTASTIIISLPFIQS